MSHPIHLFPRLESGGGHASNPLALELQAGIMVCAAVNAAVQLALPDLIDRPKSVAQLAQESATHAPSLLILLRALSSIGIFAEIDDMSESGPFFGPTEQSQVLCKDGMAALVHLWGAAYQWQSWMNLAYTIKTGKPALEASYGVGTTIWSYLSEHPEQARVFQKGLVANSRLILPALFSSYDFSAFRSVADMGGGLGELCKALLEAYPGLQVTLFDRQEVIDQAAQGGISPQVQLCAGNFFLDPPPGLDAYIFKNVLMDWGDEDYMRILKRCVEVMKPSSCLLIVEPILTSETSFTRFFSLQMAMMMRAAHHRTLEEHRCLISEAGLTLSESRELGLEQMIIECRLASPTEEAR